MKIYICGGCSVGKTTIARAIAEKRPEVELRLDISEQVFGAVFGRPFHSIVSKRQWIGDAPRTYSVICEYIERMAEKPKPGQILIYNEGPSMIISHMLWFGPTCILPMRQRMDIIIRAMALFDEQETAHVFIEGWKQDTFNQATIAIQKRILHGMDNVIYVQGRGYNETIEAGEQAVLSLLAEREG